jgi:acetyl esterase
VPRARLDPQCVEVVRAFRAANPPPARGLTAAALRAFAASAWSADAAPELAPGVDRRVLALQLGDRSLDCELFAPRNAASPPVVVHFHGGGWVHGEIENEAFLCAQIAARGQCMVVSVAYRLAPEHPFPAAVDDAYAAVAYVGARADEFGGDPGRVGVLGGSAGANLAAAAVLRARERGEPGIGCQVLFVPALQHYATNGSRRDFDAGYDFMPGWVDWFSDQYLGDRRFADDPLAAPLRANDLGSLPPTFIGVAEFDPFRDDGKAFAERLSAAGVPVELASYDGMVHSFLAAIGVVDRAEDAIDDAADFVRRQLGDNR